jgi:hypothetical protein
MCTKYFRAFFNLKPAPSFKIFKIMKKRRTKVFLQFMVLPLTIGNYFTVSHRACNLKITLYSKSQILTDFRKNIQCTVIVCSLY